MKENNLTIFSFHAEFGQDVAVLRRRLAEQGVKMNIFTYPDHRITDVAVELHTNDLTIDELRAIVDEIPDGHVMERTLEAGEFPKLKQRRESCLAPPSCPVCSGDCSSANPPVINCPMHE